MHVKPQFVSAKAYGCLQWQIDLDRTYDNPFDPDQIAVDAAFTGPDGRKMTMPAFWDESPGTPGHFMVRFAPSGVGAWSLSVRARDSHGEQTADPMSFQVGPSQNNGFMSVAPNHRYFQFSNGQSYFALGLNLAWTNSHKASAYDRWFTSLSAGGGNLARVWMARPSEPMETRAAGLGRYDQANCAFYDHVLQSALDHGIYCILTINNYRALIARDRWGPADWTDSPYNAANGGPATRPADFFTNTQCERLYRQRLRYLVARYSAFTSAFCWEFWNEQTFTNVPISPAWTKAMADYLQSIDPYHHLISTSFGSNDQAEVWRMPEINLVQEHEYPGSGIADGGPIFASEVYLDRQFDKPCLIAEAGIDFRGPDGQYDTSAQATNFHNGLWSTMMVGSAGGAMLWWWDNYVEPGNLWNTFAGAARFSSHIDWAQAHFEPLAVEALKTHPGAETFSDIVVSAGQGWGRSHGKTVEVQPNGQTMLLPPQYIYGPEKEELRTPTLLSLTMPRAGQMIVHAVGVSDYAMLRVYVDGQPVSDFAFSALPTALPAGGHAHRSDSGMYQATIDKQCAVDLSAGKHTIELANLAGDWLMIQSVRFSHARSSKYADVFVNALTDRKSGQTIAWLHDPESNWQNDTKGIVPQTLEGITISFPTAAGNYRVEWWDTYSGKIVAQSDERSPGQLNLSVPSLRRDMALRITSEK
jgi:hypothetical protein